MAEIIDNQARNEIYKQMIRAKEAETNMAFAIEALTKELEDLKASLNLSVDTSPTRDSENLITSGAVYDSILTLNKKIDALRS